MGGIAIAALAKLNLLQEDVFSIASFVFIVLIYSLLPDIDIFTSKIFRIFFFAAGVAIIVLALLGKTLGLIIIGGAMMFLTFQKHRKFVHSTIFGLAMSLPLLFLSWQHALVGLVCFVSHKIADSLW